MRSSISATSFIIGGGMCITFLKAKGFSTGTSLMEEEWVERAGKMLEKAKEKGVEMLLPVDVVCADEFANDARKEVCTVVEMPDNMMGLDIGPATAIVYSEAIEDAKTVFWNGPDGGIRNAFVRRWHACGGRGSGEQQSGRHHHRWWR